MLKRLWITALLALLAAPVLSSCAIRTARVGVSYHGELVSTTPPEPLAEVVVEPPGAGYVWVDGYWYWTGATWAWTPGYWGLPPADGHIWVRSGWIQSNGGYRYVRGYWAPPTYRRSYQYMYKKPAITRGPAYRVIRR